MFWRSTSSSIARTPKHLSGLPHNGIQREPGKRYTGKVARFGHKFGFIESDQFDKEIFLHLDYISGSKRPKVGEKVEFECEELRDGRLSARKVWIHLNNNVKYEERRRANRNTGYSTIEGYQI